MFHFELLKDNENLKEIFLDFKNNDFKEKIKPEINL